MTLRTMLRSWLRWLVPVSRPLPVVLALPAPAPMRANADPNARQWIEIEALMLLPTVDADRSGYVFPMDGGIEGGATWLAQAYPHPWSHCTRGYRELQVGIWLGRREDVRQGAWA